MNHEKRKHPRDYYTTDEVAKKLRVNKRSVRRFIKRGELIVHRFGRSVRISDEDLETFEKTHRG